MPLRLLTRCLPRASLRTQVNNPSVALPLGIVGAVSLCGGLYVGL